LSIAGLGDREQAKLRGVSFRDAGNFSHEVSALNSLLGEAKKKFERFRFFVSRS
jgi:hypothetical protein